MYETKMIPLDKIWSDTDFNCRGPIPPYDVADLAKDIQLNGLQFPITVQPASDVEGCLKDYRIVAGHRRFKAFQVLHAGDKDNWNEIPAMIRSGLGEIEARILNISENQKRKDLNLLQEAKAVKKLQDLGLTQEQVAERLGVSRSWAQVRFNLLKLPQEIQEEAAAGILNQYQIKQIYGLRSSDEQFEAVRKIKRAKEAGVKGLDVSKKKQKQAKAKRSASEMFQMIEVLVKTVGYGLHTRVLAWSCGSISTDELFEDIKEENPDSCPVWE